MDVSSQLRRAYELMHARFGHQGWWPGETPFEIAVGAILTQNTSWTNVEKAIRNLKEASVLDPFLMRQLPEARLAGLIRPAGYFNLKARRLQNFLRVLVEQFDGNLAALLSGETSEVRDRLLAVNGIGRETADSILLYAGTHHSFVVDAYTKRIFERHGWWRSASPSRQTTKSQPAAVYESLKSLCEAAMNEKPANRTLDDWRDYHAQLVMVGKHFCRPKAPDCGHCPLKALLPAGCAL